MLQLLGQEWAKRAACADVDPELFHPDKRSTRTDIAAAKAICSHCPVAGDCLQDALSRDESGIWGGLTEQERGHLRHIMRRRSA